jgi:hypothetical protein
LLLFLGIIILLPAFVFSLLGADLLHHEFLQLPFTRLGESEKEVSQATLAASAHIAQLVTLYGEHAEALWKEPTYGMVKGEVAS